MTCEEFLKVIDRGPDASTGSEVLGVIGHCRACPPCKALVRARYDSLSAEDRAAADATSLRVGRAVGAGLRTDPELMAQAQKIYGGR